MKTKELDTLAIKHEIAEKTKFEIFCGLRETEEQHIARRDDCTVREHKLYKGLFGFDRVKTITRLVKDI